MAGLPVVIRLIDPPLHEFLPSFEDLLVEVTRAEAKGEPEESYKDKRTMLAAVRASSASRTRCSGLRGCRLGLLFPEIIEMQVRAIMEAAVQLTREGVDVHPEIMIPLISTVEELRRTKGYLQTTVDAVLAEAGYQDPLQVRHHDRAAPRGPASPARSPRRPSSSPSGPTTSPRPPSASPATTPRARSSSPTSSRRSSPATPSRPSIGAASAG